MSAGAGDAVPRASGPVFRAGPTLLVSAASALMALAIPPSLPAQGVPSPSPAEPAAPHAPRNDGREALSRTLTLDDALRLAAEHNPRYRRARNDLDLNPTASRQAWGSLLPSLGIGGGTGTGFSQTTRTEDFFGRPVENPDDSRTYTSNSSQSLSLSWSLRGLGPRYDVAEARAQNRAREQAARVEARAVEVAVAQAFHEAQEREELLALEEEMLEAREREREAAERLFGLARRDRTDVLGAELEVARQRSRIEDARGEVRKALLALASVVGAPDLDRIRIEPEPVGVFDPSELETEALVAEALARNPGVLREEAALDRSRAAADGAGWERYSPDLSITAGFSRSAFAADQLALFDLSPGDSRSGSLRVGLSLPLERVFLSGAHQERQAEVGLRNQIETLREVRLEVSEEVRARLMDLETAHRSLELAERQRDLAAERLRLTREAYGLARRSFDELQSAVREAAEARREALSTRYSFVRARLELEAAAGVEVEPPR